MNIFTAKLRSQRFYLLVSALFVLCLIVIACGGLGIGILDEINQWRSLQESAAFYFVTSQFLAAALILLIGIVKLFGSRPAIVDLARVVEDRYPQLMESLSCAVEIEEKKGRPEGLFEEALFRQVEQDVKSIPFASTIVLKRVNLTYVLILAIAAIFFTARSYNADSSPGSLPG